MGDRFSLMPQWATGPRLLRRGESIELRFSLPEGVEQNGIAVFPRYLEQARPGEEFTAGGDLGWLDALESERIDLSFENGRASATYLPEACGNYIARWTAGDEVLYRYFSVIDDDWTVLRFSPFNDLEPEPTLHATGIPLDYRLPVEQFDPDSPLYRRLLSYHRLYGDAVVPVLPDTRDLGRDERMQQYGIGLTRARSMLPDPNDARSARVDMRHDLDPGYTEAFERLGVSNHYGIPNANAKPYLGMPEFPYFASQTDIRKVNQGEGGPVLAHQWDFCGSWHFLGPVSWHYPVSEGSWEIAAGCLRQGMKEAESSADLSGHPAFLFPLYDGVVKHYTPMDGLFTEGVGGEPHRTFVERYQRFMAFELTREYKLAYARSIDIADYYRRHYKVTPRTVFVSKTDHVMYDMWWLNNWAHEHRLEPRERIPWLTGASAIMADRRTRKYWKDPLSYEYILVEDQRRSVRFERESPNPIWWFDYTVQERGPRGSAITHVETPDVKIVRSGWDRVEGGFTMGLKMLTAADFPDYAIALWGIPWASDVGMPNVETNAKEFVLVKNTDGEHHVVLFFDLTQGAEVRVTLREP